MDTLDLDEGGEVNDGPPLAAGPSASLTASTDSVYPTVGHRLPMVEPKLFGREIHGSPYNVVDPIIKIMSSQRSTASFYCLPHHGAS